MAIDEYPEFSYVLVTSALGMGGRLSSDIRKEAILTVTKKALEAVKKILEEKTAETITMQDAEEIEKALGKIPDDVDFILGLGLELDHLSDLPEVNYMGGGSSLPHTVLNTLIPSLKGSNLQFLKTLIRYKEMSLANLRQGLEQIRARVSEACEAVRVIQESQVPDVDIDKDIKSAGETRDQS